jgi:prevent-host-death family protein
MIAVDMYIITYRGDYRSDKRYEGTAEPFKLIQQVNTDHKPVLITGKRGSAVLLPEKDWHAIEQTLYLDSIPGVAETIQEGLKTPASELEDTVEW